MQLPEGYVPLAEAWPVWLSQRYPRSARKILDHEKYRPPSLVTRTCQIGCDIITGDPIMGYEPPDERARAHAQSILLSGHADHEKNTVENEFWLEFCNRSGVWAPEKYPRWTAYCLEHPDKPRLIHFKNGSWHRVAKGQWEALRLYLWTEIVVEDLERVDHGPPRWKARALGEIPSGYAVDCVALEALLSYGPDFHELDAEERARQLAALRQSKDATIAPPPVVEQNAPDSGFDARADFLPEQRFSPWAKGQFMSDWKSALRMEFGQYAPFSVILRRALLLDRQRKEPGQLAGENAIIHFPNPDGFPRVNWKDEIGRHLGHSVFKGLVQRLESGEQAAIGFEVSAAGQVASIPKEIERVAWSAIGLDEGYEGDAPTAYFKMDDAAYRGETLTGISGEARPDCNKPAFKDIRFAIEDWARLVEAHHWLPETVMLPAKLTAEQATEALPTPVQKPNLFSEANAKAVYQKRVADWPASICPPSRDADIAHMKSEFPGISRDVVRELRDKFAPNGWKRRGRRPSC